MKAKLSRSMALSRRVVNAGVLGGRTRRMDLRNGLFFLCTMAFLNSPSRAATLHVPSEYPTIGSALASSVSGDSVVIACGLYSEPLLQLRSGVTVVSQSGDPSCVTIDAQSHGAFAGNNLVETTTLRGLTIKNALEGGGAGVRCIANCHVQLSNCVFEDNSATDGAAVAVAIECVLHMSSCVFRNNRASLGENQRGGAVYVNASRAIFEGCLFEENTARFGGAIFSFNGGEIEVTDCQFRRNGATGGGAINLEDTSRLVVREGLFESNEALGTDEALGTGGAILSHLASSIRIASTVFSDNSAGVGGAIAVSGGSGLEILGGKFVGNSAEYGGALDIIGVPFLIQNVLFWDNEATVGSGGAALLVESSGMIESCTIHGNTAVGAGGAFLVTGEKAMVDLNASILTHNVSTEVLACQNGAQVNPSCIDVYGNDGGDWVGCLSGFQDLNGNFSADPLYCNANAGRFDLRADSPCADHGSVLCGSLGAYPVGCGAVSVESKSWGQIKRLYR